MRQLLLLLTFFVALQGFAQIPRTQPETLLTTGSNQDNYDATGVSNLYIEPTANISISGFVAKKGQWIVITNRSSEFSITIEDEGTGSDAANRVDLDGDYVIGPLEEAVFKYVSYDSRWALSSFTLGQSSGTDPPGTQASALGFTSITSDEVVATWIIGSGEYHLLVLSETSITTAPTGSLTGNSVFGSGDAFGGGFAVFSDIGNTVTITGLDPDTEYFGVVYTYHISPTRYNTTINEVSFTTLADAATPTQQFVIDAIIPEQEQAHIIGTRGNGDNILALISIEGQPDTDPSDGNEYDVDDVIGNSRVGYKGSAHDFHITGLERDRAAWVKIMEYENTGFLYNILAEIDSLPWTDWATDSLFVQTTVPDGQVHLEANGRLFYDFTRATGTGDVSNGNPGLADQTGNGHTGTIVGTPDIETQSISSYTVPSLETASGESTAISTGHDGSAFFSTDFEVFIDVSTSDGQHGSSQYFCGTTHSAFTDIFRISTNGTGNMVIRYANGGTDATWTSTSAVFANDANTRATFRIKMDFTTDTFGVWKDGSTVAGSFTTSSMAALNPASFSSDRNFYVGNLNSPTSAPATILITRFAITDLNDTQQASDITALFGYLPSIVDEGWDKWTKIPNIDFTAETIDDTLNVSGNPAGYGDYMIWDEIIPDTLEAVNVGFTAKIADDLASGDVGIGPIWINDLSSEANYAAYVLFITNPASANFGKVQIYTGNGAVADPDGLVYRGQSSNAFLPAKDSVYEIRLERTIEDAANTRWTARVIDKYDSVEISTSHLVPGALSSQFLGTTAQVGIWLNGGPFKVNPFYVRRTGLEDIDDEDPGPGPTPGVVDYEVVIMKSGNDADDCTEEEPCLTAVRAADRVNELGSGAEPDVYFGPGTFTENALVFWPSFTDTIDGSGDTQTIFKGAPNLYTDISSTVGNVGHPFSSAGYLFNFTSTTSTDVSTVMRNFSMEGNRDVGGYANSMKGAVRIFNRDGIYMDNVDIRYFWSVGIWTQDVDGFHYNSGHLYRNGFSNVSGATYSLGNIEMFGTNINIWVTNSLIDSPVFNEGRGLGHSGAPNFYRLDFHGHGNEFIVGGSSDADGDHHFAFEFLQYFMNSGDSISFRDNLFRKNVSFNYTGTQAGTHYFDGNRFTFDLPKNLAIEAQGPNIIITNNYFANCVGKVIGTYNGWGAGAPIPHCPRDCHASNQVWQGLTVTNNIIELVAGTISGDAIFGDQLWRRDDVDISNNTIVFTSSLGQIYRLVRGGTQGVNDNWNVYNNAIQGLPRSGSTVWSTANGSSTFTNSLFRYNRSSNLDVTQLLSGSGMSESNNSVVSPLGFNLSGSKWPVLIGTYYAWPTGNTVLKNTGLSGADIGVYED